MEIDKRILNLSYSAILTLHECPRKFQLYRMNGKVERDDPMAEITFAYGHVVGLGVQCIFEGLSLGDTLWKMFLMWDTELLAKDDKRNKSFFGAAHAIRQLHYARESGFLQDYDLVYYEGKPATELSFSIALPDGFIYRGFVDLVLRNRISGKVVVIECKTVSGTTVNPAQYKNSAQAIGYSIVLDAIFPDLSSYEVYYLVYPTKKEEWETIPFEKSFFQRALWIRELLLEVDTIRMYEQAEIYPMHGESCYDWFRECEYLQYCTLSTHHLVKPLTQEESTKIDKELAKFQIKVGITDLIDAQVRKNLKAPAEVVLIDGDEML